MVASEKSSIDLYNCSIYGSQSLYGGVFYIDELSNVKLEDSIIEGSKTKGTLFDCGSSNLKIINSTIRNSQNNMFLLIGSSTLNLSQTNIFNHECSSILQGCLIFAQSNSFVFGKDLNISQISSKTNDNIFFSSSSGLFESIQMTKIQTNKMKGACLGSSASNISVVGGNFEEYNGNCFNNEASFINIKNSTFHHNYGVERRDLYLSTFICYNCKFYNIEFTTFFDNKFTDKGSAMQIMSDYKTNNEIVLLNTIKNCSFIENEAFEDGGAIYLRNQHVSIEGSFFSSNLAQNGGAIFTIMKGNLLTIKILTQFFY